MQRRLVHPSPVRVRQDREPFMHRVRVLLLFAVRGGKRLRGKRVRARRARELRIRGEPFLEPVRVLREF